MSQEPIRVAHFIGKLNAAGVEAVINNYYRNIDRSRYQFDFFIDSDSNCEPPQVIRDLGARYYVVSPCWKFWKYLPEVGRILRENGYEIVHSNLNTLSLFPLCAAWCAGVPVRINHNHNTAAKGETKRNILKAMLKPFARVFATDLCACSALAGNWLFGPSLMKSGRVTVLNNAIDLSRYRYDEAVRISKRKELGLENRFVVGHVGRFCYQKNHDFLIKSFAEVAASEPSAVLMLVGIGELTDDVRAQVADLGLTGRVLFLGARTDVNELYQAMDVFVLPSRYEGLPVVGVEAQASGLPCIVSSGITSEVMFTSVIRMLPLKDGPLKWAECILDCRFFSRHDVSEEVRNAGFDIVSEARKLESYYDSCLARPSKGSGC